MAQKINMKLILEFHWAGMQSPPAGTFQRTLSVMCSTSLIGWAYPMRTSHRWMRMRFTASFIRTSLPWKTCMTNRITNISIRN